MYEFLAFAVLAAVAMSAAALIGCLIHDWVGGWLGWSDDDAADDDRVD